MMRSTRMKIDYQGKLGKNKGNFSLIFYGGYEWVNLGLTRMKGNIL